MNKLFDYMLAKKPIICGIDTPTDIVEIAECGVSIEPENPKAIAEAVDKLLNMKNEEIIELGNNGYNYVIENHNYAFLAKKFVDAVSLHSQNKD